MSRTKHKPPLPGAPNAAEAPPEPRQQTDGFDFPLGVAAGQATPVRFFCHAAQCPGYPYSASDQAHPVATCGSLMNSLHKEGKLVEMTKENTALAAVESTGFAADRLSGIITAGEADPSELVAPNNVEPPEPPSLPFELERPNEPEVAPESPPTKLEATLPRTIELLGSLWRTERGSYLEVAALCLDHMVQICEYSSGNGVHAWEITNHPESIALAVLRHSELEAVAQAPAWVDALRLRRFEAFGEGIVGTESETPDQIAPADPRQNLSRDIDDHCGDIASELGIDRVHVMRLTDTALQTIGQVVTLQELTASSPVLKALGEHFMQSGAREYLLKLAAAIANGPIRKTINEAAQDAVDEFEGKLGEVNEQLESIQTELLKTKVEFEKELDASEYPEWSKAIQSSLATLKEHQERALGDLDHRLSLLSSKLDTINDDLSTVEQRMDEIQPDWKPTKGKNAPKAKPSQPPKGPKADFLRHSREELMEARRQGKIQTPLDDEDEIVDLDDDEDEVADLDDDEDFDDEDDAVDAFARPAAKPIKKAPQAKAKPAAPASKPPKKGGFDFKVPVGRPRKKAGRPRKPMPPVDSRPMGKTPKSASLKAIDQFMGRKKNPKVRILLSKVAVAKLPKFLEKAKKGFFHMEDTGWDIQQQSAFIKWFYSKH